MLDALKPQIQNALPLPGDMRKEILIGLSRSPKAVHPKYLYDERGSELFESICKLEEYYPVHAETEILVRHGAEMAAWMGSNVTLIEPGCGSCTKVRLLIPHLENLHAYVPMDISKEMLLGVSARLQEIFPNLPLYPVIGDYTHEFKIDSELAKGQDKKVIFFPGSTIGNLTPEEARALLKKMTNVLGSGGGLLIGVDKKKDRKFFHLAYDDPKGVTAEFNLNLLERMNREFGADFERHFFNHSAFYNEEQGRVEMHLVSRRPQVVKIGNEKVYFSQGETIHTENSYKYSPEEFSRLASNSGFRLLKTWEDPKALFCVYYFEVSALDPAKSQSH